jgi:hypothetical protein
MTALRSVLGVQGCVGLVVGRLHRKSPLFSGAAGHCVECVGLSRTRACTREFNQAGTVEKYFHANPLKANTPYTLCTFLINSLYLLGFKCVESVLGWAVCVLGMELIGSSGHEC